MDRYDRVKNCPDIRLKQDGSIVSGKNYVEDSEVELTLLGFNEHDEMMAVSRWDWSIIKIKNAVFETVGKLDMTLHDAIKNPQIVLKQAKVLSMKEIEEKLGHPVIVKEMIR